MHHIPASRDWLEHLIEQQPPPNLPRFAATVVAVVVAAAFAVAVMKMMFATMMTVELKIVVKMIAAETVMF